MEVNYNPTQWNVKNALQYLVKQAMYFQNLVTDIAYWNVWILLVVPRVQNTLM
jgi:hypothetical protein